MSITRRIENHTEHFIFLPPLSTENEDGKLVEFPGGIRLMPGLNTVPVLYLTALEALERPVYDRYGVAIKGKKRYPGREVMAQLLAPIVNRKLTGTVIEPQITVHADPMADREDGPPPPAVLPENIKAANAIIDATKSKDTLKNWLKTDKRSDIKEKINGRLANG